MQVLLNIKDSSKATLLVQFLKSLSYVSSVKEISEEIIPDTHKKLVRDRVKKSKEAKLLDWDKIKNDFDGI